MEARHHRADRDVEDLRRVRVREVADVDEHDDLAELWRDVSERVHDGILRQALDDTLLVEDLLARRGCELVGEEVVALLARWMRRPRSTFRFVRMRRSQARMFVPAV